MRERLKSMMTSCHPQMKMERSSCTCYTSHEYTQILYDALDSMARSIEKRLATQGGTVLVSLGVHDSLYHKVSFRDQLREKSETACLLTQCHSKWFPSADGWNNEHFVYARRTFEGEANTPGSFMDSIFSERFLGGNFLGFNFGLGDAGSGTRPSPRMVSLTGLSSPRQRVNTALV